VDILFYSPDSQRIERWISLLRKEGVGFNPIVWRPGIPPTGARFAIVRLPEEGMFGGENNLKAIFNVGAGVEALMKLKSLPAHIDVVRLEDSGMANKMAEYVMHAVADISRGMDAYRRAHRGRSWLPAPYASFDEWPTGIMGLGVIGRKIALGLANLGYPVSGWSRSPKTLDGVHCYAGPDGFKRFLARSRVLVNVLPLTPETENILDEPLFSLLPPDSYIINIARGEHLNESALLERIAGKKIAGAVLDVFRTEPLPADHLFWDNPAIRITPHIAGTTDIQAAMAQIAAKIKAHEAGLGLTGVVDRAMGY